MPSEIDPRYKIILHYAEVVNKFLKITTWVLKRPAVITASFELKVGLTNPSSVSCLIAAYKFSLKDVRPVVNHFKPFRSTDFIIPSEASYNETG